MHNVQAQQYDVKQDLKVNGEFIYLWLRGIVHLSMSDEDLKTQDESGQKIERTTPGEN
jgi:hypothetical protein